MKLDKRVEIESRSVNALIFDMGGVVLFFDHMLTCRRLANLTNHTPAEVYNLIFKEELEQLYDEGKISTREFYRSVMQRLGLNIRFDRYREIWTNIFEENIQMTDLIRRLRKSNHLIYLLSNTNELHFEYVTSRFSIINEFDEYILSYEVGNRKPDISMFRAAMKKSGLPPNKHIYIDDIDEFVRAAQSIGMKGIAFRSTQQLKNELRSNGVVL